MKLHFVMLGRTRRAELRALFEDYVERIARYAPVEVHELRTPAALARVKAGPGALWVLLDAAGAQFTSAQFARWLGQQRDRGRREMVFLCGNAEGFPRQAREALGARDLTPLALSTLTMPHELARVALAEQLYRACTLLAGHPYSK